MNAYAVLAGIFASVIVLGCAVVYAHDAIQDRRSPSASRGGGGQRVVVWPTLRPRLRSSSPGTVVWVKAGARAPREPSELSASIARRRRDRLRARDRRFGLDSRA